MEKKDFAIKPIKKWGPILDQTTDKDTKDPCIVFDGKKWHIFGSIGTVVTEEWGLLHATADNIEGPWKYEGKIKLEGEEVQGEHVAAPSVIFDQDEDGLHMFVQNDFIKIGGTVEHLISSDGAVFKRTATALHPLPPHNEKIEGSPEAGLYDPHVSIIKGHKYMVYSGIPHPGELFSKKPQPDIYLAKSETNTWKGPWNRVKKILEHEDIDWHHNQHDHPNYEWGIEGAQLLELPNGLILLNATCFLPYGDFGTRQRVFFALAEHVEGPYKSLGPVISHSFDPWESGENGHASAVVYDNKVYLFYQARNSENKEDARKNNWRYGIATFDINELEQHFRNL